jgi:hypothetical protein
MTNGEPTKSKVMSADLKLTDATVQQIQFELIRRWRFNAFDGPTIVASLERHRDLWLAVHMDRFGVYRKDHPNWIPAMSLIKLRDLNANVWNVDTLVILTDNIQQARQLAEIAQQEDWAADDVTVQENTEEIEMALGEGPCDYGLLTLWWD